MTVVGQFEIERSGSSLARLSPTQLFGLLIGSVVAGDLADGQAANTHSDDFFRVLQIRDLLQDNQLFDMVQPVISMPEPYVSHYSRIVDLPYYLLAKLMMPAVGIDWALTLSTWIIPLLLLVAFCRLALAAGQMVLGRLDWKLVSVLALGLALPVLEFSPTRVDHHNMLLVLLMCMIVGFGMPARSGGIAIGAAMAVSTAIGFEVLPFFAVGMAALSLAAVFDMGDARAKLQWAGLSLAVISAPAAALSFGPAILGQVQCDIVSKPWLIALTGGGLLLAFVPLAWRAQPFSGPIAGPIMKSASLVGPAIALVGGLVIAYPQCLEGHYQIVDPLSRRLWLDTVDHEFGLLHQFAIGRFFHIPFATAFFFSLIVAAPGIWRSLKQGRYDLAAIYLVAASGVAVYLMLERSIRITAALTAVLLPVALLVARGDSLFRVGPDARRYLIAAFFLPLIVFLGAYLATPKLDVPPTAIDQMHYDWCRGEDTSMLDRIPPSRIMAPLGAIVPIGNDHHQHRVATYMLHRAAPGMKRMFTVFTSGDRAERAAALAPFDYLAICDRGHFARMEQTPLYTDLIDRRAVPGLVPVEPENQSRFRVYRIDHSAL